MTARLVPSEVHFELSVSTIVCLLSIRLEQGHNFISNVDVMNLMKINYDILATEIDNFGFLEDWRKYGKNKLKKNSGCDMFKEIYLS